MKTCDYCERENPDDAVRCLECGTSEFKSSRRDELQAGATPVAVSSAPPEKSLALRGGLTGRWMVGPGPARDAKDRAESRFDKWNWFRGPAHIVAPRVSGGAGAWVYNSDSRGGQATLRFKDNEVTLKAGAGGLKLLLVAMMIPLGLGGIAILKDSENYPEHRWIPVLMLALAAVFFFLLLRKGRRWSFTQDCIANACLVYFPRRRAWGIQFVAGAIVVNRGSTASDPLSSASLTVVTLQLGKREVAEALLNRLPTRRMEVLDVDQQERIHFQNELKAAVARAWVTPALIAANGIILGWMWVTSIGPVDWGYLALTWGANFGPLTLTGEPWRLLTSCFVHFGVAHLGLNMWALWSTGRTVERLQGNGRFLVIYLASGLAASMASLCWNPFVISAGASGAVMGVYGSLAGYLARERRGIPSVVLHGVLSGLAAFVINNLLFAFSVRGIDHAAHIGGLVTGAILGFAAARPVELKARARASRKSAAALAAATVAVTVLLAFRLPSAGNLLSREEGAAVFDAFSRIGVSRTDLQAVSATNPAAAHHLLAAGIRMRPEDVVLMQTVRSNRADLLIRRMQALQASEAALDYSNSSHPS